MTAEICIGMCTEFQYAATGGSYGGECGMNFC
jgi:hypothetical protein